LLIDSRGTVPAPIVGFDALKTNIDSPLTTMKPSATLPREASRGMTLIEMTVVVLVLLAMTVILFIGAKAWKKGSDRSANVMNLRNVQMAMRGHATTNDIPQQESGVTGGPVPHAVIFGAANDGVGGYLRFPATIASVTYTNPVPSQINTATGVLYLRASATGLEGGEYGPKTGATRDW
jgi:type II secretory pathway pseudopilin PulG